MRAGERWTYRNAAGNSRVIILREEKELCHIAITDVCIGGMLLQIEHIPITRAALEESLISMESIGSVPSWKDLYREWKRDQGGVFSISVAEIVEYVQMGPIRICQKN